MAFFKFISDRRVAGSLLAFLLGFWVLFPAVYYKHGTAENITVEVLREPFIDGDDLVYRWSGDVVRACDVTLRRSIIDSEGVVTELIARNLTQPPSDAIGYISYEVAVTVPLRLSEGSAVYQVVEIPKCSWMQERWPIAIEYPPVEFTVRR